MTTPTQRPSTTTPTPTAKEAGARVKAVIFDFDGLVVDTETPAFQAWSSIYREHGAELELALFVRCVGASYAKWDPVEHLSTLIGRALDREGLIADKERRKLAACNAAPALPGVLERFAEARALGLKIAVASSSSAAWVLHHLGRLDLRAKVDTVTTRDDVTRVKPFPDIYLHAAKSLGVAPGECIAFEDSSNGITAAVAAGIRACYAVPNGVTASLDFSHATAVHPSLAAVSLATIVSVIS